MYEDEGVMWADDLDPVTFCEECAPADGNFIPLPNSPGRESTATTTSGSRPRRPAHSFGKHRWSDVHKYNWALVHGCAAK